MQEITLEQALIDNIPTEAKKLLVAVSGGVDSVVLLSLLRRQAKALQLSLEVAHLDHQLRVESSSDAGFVVSMCAEMGIRCHCESCDVSQLAKQTKASLEMAGRQARREFLQRVRAEVGAEFIVLAHHRNDQVETFLLRLLRGSGVSGLTSMGSCQGEWLRPLLNCSRNQIMDYASEHELGWVEDVSNGDPVFLRNRLRTTIIPQLKEINPKFDKRIVSLIGQVKGEESYWQEQVAIALPQVVISNDDGFRLDRQSLLQLHPALRLRVLREALRQVRGDLQRIEAVHLQAIEDLLQHNRSQAQLDLPYCWVARRYEKLWIRCEEPLATIEFDLILPLPGEVELPDGRVLRATIGSEQEGESLNVVEFSTLGLGSTMSVRSWLPGDRFVPQGMTGRKRLKRFFSDNMVELERRHQVPILLNSDEILWLVGMRRSNAQVADLESGSVLRVELL